MRTGELRERIRIERSVATKTDEGEELIGWQLVATVAASIKPMRGQEKLIANQIAESADTVITIRWAPALDTLTREARLLHKTQVFDIKDIVHVNHDRRWIELYATTGLNAG